MKEAEDDGEIVIKSMFLHLMTGERCKLLATSTSRSRKSQVLRGFEHIMEVSVPQDTKQLVEVTKISDQDRILQGAVEEIIDVSSPPPCEKSEELTEIDEMGQIISLERLQQRCVEQLVDMTAPHVRKELVEVMRLMSQERH